MRDGAAVSQTDLSPSPPLFLSSFFRLIHCTHRPHFPSPSIGREFARPTNIHSCCPNSGLSFRPWTLGDSQAEAMLVHDGRSGRRGGRGYVYLFRKQAALTLFLTLSLFRPFSVTLLRLDAQKEKQQLFSIPNPLLKKCLPFGQEVRHFGDPIYVHAGGVFTVRLFLHEAWDGSNGRFLTRCIIILLGYDQASSGSSCCVVCPPLCQTREKKILSSTSWQFTYVTSPFCRGVFGGEVGNFFGISNLSSRLFSPGVSYCSLTHRARGTHARKRKGLEGNTQKVWAAP